MPYLPTPNGLFEACMDIFPVPDILRINTIHIKDFTSMAYLVRPEFVQFFEVSVNLIQRCIHLTE